MKKFSAVIFDLEGTIIDSERAWDDIDTQFLANYGVVYDPREYKHLAMGKSINEVCLLIKEKYGLKTKLDDLVAERKAIAKEALAKDIEFIDAFPEFFEKEVRDKYPTAIATSLFREYLQPIIVSKDLNGMFGSHIYSIEDIGFISKPNPDIFLYAAVKLNVDPKEFVVIEDSPNGIEAAKRAGMRSVGIFTSPSVNKKRLASADRVIDSFSELIGNFQL